MSRVFVAEDRALQRKVAIKVFTPALSGMISAERFQREIHVVARLQHPQIVPLFSAGTADGILYYTMPYIEGESLRAKLDREHTLNSATAARILHDIARALEYAHAHGVIHRDIKPDNILLSDGSACVADFGIARAISIAATNSDLVEGASSDAITTGVGVGIGTPAYVSPEQATGTPNIDARADLYSFGCVAFELLTGNVPFSGRSRQALIAAHVMERAPIERLRAPHIPPQLADLVRKCLEKSPDSRPANASDVVRALESIVAGSAAVGATTEISSSIAVLPFQNMSDDKENEYFADGISEEIINALTHVEGLRVAGRTSSFSFRDTNTDLATIGDRLNVETILEGSVRKSKTQLRITAQLIKASDGYHLWSERFDRELTDVFAIQDEIATAIAAKLRVSLNRSGDLAKPLTTSIEAYELYVKGRALYYVPGRPIADAIGYFERAIKLDDRFALCYASLADALTLAGYYGLIKPLNIVERAGEAASRAVALAPGNSDAHHAVALWRTFFGGDRHAALREWANVVRGSALRTQVRCSYAVFGLGLLRSDWTAATAEIDLAIDLDPLNGFAYSMLAMIKTFAGDLDHVVEYARRSIELDPNSFWSHLALQRALHSVGMHADAQRQGLSTLDITGRHPFVMAELAVDYASVGNQAAAEAVYEELVARARMQHVQPSPLALCATAAGRLTEAIDLCHLAFDERDAHILWAINGVWDGWEPLYAHPAWKGVRQRVVSTWRAGGAALSDNLQSSLV